MFIMIAGVGIIGALASILASVLVGGGSSDDDTPAPDEEPTAGRGTGRYEGRAGIDPIDA